MTPKLESKPEPLRLGPPVAYVPVLQSAADYRGWTRLPMGYERVDAVTECPICVVSNLKHEGGSDGNNGKLPLHK
jgi:hypothetical protein